MPGRVRVRGELPLQKPGRLAVPGSGAGGGRVGVAWGGGGERRAHLWAPTAVASAPRSGRGVGPPALPPSPGSGLEVSGVSWSTAPPLPGVMVSVSEAEREAPR